MFNPNDMPLLMTPLARAVASLRQAVGENTDALTETQRLLARDGVIQRFEYTYELSWKFMRRALKESEGEARNKTSRVYDEAVAEQVHAAAVRFADDAERLLERLQPYAA
jgi:hypothetical protein